MAKGLTPSPKMQFFNAVGDPLVGGKLYTYASGTTTPLATYTDATGATANANPIILDSRGEGSIWLSAVSYKFVLHDADDVPIWTGDAINGAHEPTIARLNDSDGSSLVGFLQAGIGAVPRTAQDKMREIVSVKDFGAVGDGVTDDTAAIQAALDFGAENGLWVEAGNGIYGLSSVFVKNGLAGFSTPGGVLKANSASTQGIVKLDGPYVFGGTAVDKCTISVNIDMGSGALFGIYADGCTNCVIRDCYIYNITDSVAASKFAMYLYYGSTNNKILNNTIFCYENPNTAYANCGIAIFGESTDYAGFFNDGNIVDPTTPCVGNVVSGNSIYYGDVGIDILANNGAIVSDNYLYKTKSRAIYVANASSYCNIVGNNIIGFGSSAVLLGYGANNNNVASNVCRQIAGYNLYGAEAAINVNTGAFDNSIEKNTIDTFTNYGVYLAVNVIDNVVDGNIISGYYLSAIALENEWQDSPNAGALYSRPNYAAPPIGSKWASKNTEGNVIQNNVIYESYPGREVGSIYMSQLGSQYYTQNNVIQNNSMLHNQANNKPLCFYEDTSGYLTKNWLVGNHVKDAVVTRMISTRGKSHFVLTSGNDALDTASVNFTNGDTTPSVGLGGRFVCVNTAPTTITNFDDSFNGQIIMVKLNANTTIQYSGALIFTKGSVNIVGSAATNEWVTFIRDNTVWRELSRSF